MPAPHIDKALAAEIRRVAWLRHECRGALAPEDSDAMEAAIYHGVKLMGGPSVVQRVHAIETLRGVTRNLAATPATPAARATGGRPAC